MLGNGRLRLGRRQRIKFIPRHFQNCLGVFSEISETRGGDKKKVNWVGNGKNVYRSRCQNNKRRHSLMFFSILLEEKYADAGLLEGIWKYVLLDHGKFGKG